MIGELIAVGLVVSAFIAVYVEEAVYSVASLAITLTLAAILYSLNEAGFAAIFQFAISAGTLAVLFLSGETLTEKKNGEKPLQKLPLGLAAGLILSIPSLLFSFQTVAAGIHPEVQFPDALWNLRAIDVILQGLVILTVASGVAIILNEKRRKPK